MRLTKAEIVVVLAVMAILATLAVPFVLHQRNAARRLTCDDRLRRLAMAMQKYDTTRERLPGFRQNDDPVRGWAVEVLPFLTVAGDAENTHLTNAHAALLQEKQGPQRLPELLCPATNDFKFPAPLSYVANCAMPDAKPTQDDAPPDWQANGMFFNRDLDPPQRVTTSLAWLAQHDGEKFTLLLSENLDAGSWKDATEALTGFVWAANLDNGVPTALPTVLPINHQRSQGDGSLRFARPSSEHVGGVNAAMADASTQFVSERIDYLVFQRLMTADGAHVKAPGRDEPLDPPWRYGE